MRRGHPNRAIATLHELWIQNKLLGLWRYYKAVILFVTPVRDVGDKRKGC